MKINNQRLLGGKLYIGNKETGEWELLGEVKPSTATLGMNPELHKKVKKICKFFAHGYDSQTGLIEETCRNPRNTPSGCSWGMCTPESCPLASEICTK